MSKREATIMRFKLLGCVLVGLWLDVIALRYLPAPKEYWDYPVVWASLLLALIVVVLGCGVLIFSIFGVWFTPVSTLEDISSFAARNKGIASRRNP